MDVPVVHKWFGDAKKALVVYFFFCESDMIQTESPRSPH